MTILSFTSLFTTLLTVKNKSQQINCHWIRLNWQHQKQISRRVDGHNFRLHSSWKTCFNQQGSITPFALIILTLVLVISWVTLANMLSYRKSILQREQLLACTAWMEKKSLTYNLQMDKLNGLIKKIRLVEMSSSINIPAATTLRAQRTLLELKQQHLTLYFAHQSKLPFENCQISTMDGLILFHQNHTFLKRNPTFRNAEIKIAGKAFITLEKSTMMLAAQRTKGKFIYKRFLKELPIVNNESIL